MDYGLSDRIFRSFRSLPSILPSSDHHLRLECGNSNVSRGHYRLFLLGTALWKTIAGNAIRASVQPRHYADKKRFQEQRVLLGIRNIRSLLRQPSPVQSASVRQIPSLFGPDWVYLRRAGKPFYSFGIEKSKTSRVEGETHSDADWESVYANVSFRVMSQLYLRSLGLDFVFSDDTMLAGVDFRLGWIRADGDLGERET